jgi:hypothetical protein
MNTKMTTRLKRLEVQEAEKVANRSRSRIHSEEQWLDWFSDPRTARYLAAEPDYPAAVENLRRAIEAARIGSPDWEPPSDYLPDLAIEDRRGQWRRKRQYEGLDSAMFWMLEMTSRVVEGKPPVTEAEFHELKEWFLSNEERIPHNKGIDVGEGRRLGRTNLRYALSRGPRSYGVTELVEDLRALRSALT